MAIRFSDAATALMAGDVGLRRALANATVTFFTGDQPASANTGYGSAQPIISFTKDDAVYTPNIEQTWKVTFSTYTPTTTIDTVKIDNLDILGGATSFGADIATGCAAIAAAINANIYNCDFTATATATEVIVKAPRASGAFFNSGVLTVTKTGGTLTATVNGVITTGVTGGNGLTFDTPAENVDTLSFDLVKPTAQTWKGKNGFGPATSAATAVFSGIATGTTYTAGWGRITCDSGDSGSTATSGASGYVRVDFSVGTSGTDFIMSPAATFTVNTTSGSEIETTLNSFRLRVKKNMA
jgi:hypothetical protein